MQSNKSLSNLKKYLKQISDKNILSRLYKEFRQSNYKIKRKGIQFSQLKMGKRPFLRKRNNKSSTEYEKVLNIRKQQGSVNSSQGEISPHTCHKNNYSKIKVQ